MNDTPLDPTLSPEERLLLLQLLTRDAMAARRNESPRTATREDDDRAAEADVSASDVEVHPSWRLLPTETKLHRWQSECLGVWMEHGHGTVKVATGAGKTHTMVGNQTQPGLMFNTIN